MGACYGKGYSGTHGMRYGVRMALDDVLYVCANGVRYGSNRGQKRVSTYASSKITRYVQVSPNPKPPVYLPGPGR
jgi:hypothetical protein